MHVLDTSCRLDGIGMLDDARRCRLNMGLITAVRQVMSVWGRTLFGAFVISTRRLTHRFAGYEVTRF